jgi:hypothetical protein
MAIYIAIYESEWASSTNVYCTGAESNREWGFFKVNLVCELSIPNFYFASTYYNAETCIQCKQRQKIKWSQSRIPYYANSLAGFQIILSGDVESNPGPNRLNASKSQRASRPQYPECSKPVRRISKQYLCTMCKSLTHLKCANVSAKTTFPNATEPKPWRCSHCLLSNLPFYSVRDLAELS